MRPRSGRMHKSKGKEFDEVIVYDVQYQRRIVADNTSAERTTQARRNLRVAVIPSAHVKNRTDRIIVLNDVAKSVIDSVRGEHPQFAFTRADR
jgi:hypothetical protein